MLDLIRDGTKIPKREFVRNNGLNIDNEVWRKLDNIRSAAITKYGSNNHLICQSLQNFIERWKRGSKKVRQILCFCKDEFIPHNIVKFAENTEIVIDLDMSKELNKLWCKNYLSNDVRVFIFNMHNNTLPVNVILSHFVREVGRNCTFCDLIFNPEEEPETVLHFFYDCQIVEELRSDFFKWLTDDDLFDVLRREYFSSFGRGSRYFNEFLQLSAVIFKKYLWDMRARKRLPVLEKLKEYFSLEIDTLRSISGEFKKNFSNCGLRVENKIRQWIQ
jgi:hypothetical protein